MIEILPGEITDPNWSGPRCAICARAMGGDGSMWRTCADVPQPHVTMESIPREMRNKFFLERVWDNVLRMAGLAAAIEWMTAGRKKFRPIDLLQDGEGEKVLAKQFEEWPQLEREIERMRRLRAA